MELCSSPNLGLGTAPSVHEVSTCTWHMVGPLILHNHEAKSLDTAMHTYLVGCASLENCNTGPLFSSCYYLIPPTPQWGSHQTLWSHAAQWLKVWVKLCLTECITFSATDLPTLSTFSCKTHFLGLVSTPVGDNPRHLQTSPQVPWVAKPPPFEK